MMLYVQMNKFFKGDNNT